MFPNYPPHIMADLNAAKIAYQQKDFPGVLKHTKRILLSCPDLSDVHSYRASAFAEMGQLREALEEFNIAVRLDPACAPTYRERGLLLFSLGEDGAAQD